MFGMFPVLIAIAYVSKVGLLLVGFLNDVFGEGGVYVTAAIVGTVDTNAITLSLSALTLTGDVLESIAVTDIVLAVVVNTLVKIAIVWLFGTALAGRLVAGILGVTALVGVGVVWLL